MTVADAGISGRLGSELAAGPAREAPHGLRWVLRDSWTEALRHLAATRRNPDLLVWAAIQPIMFVVLFVYVFGGAVQVPGGSYKQFVVPGIFAQTIVFGSAYTGIGIAEDMTKGFIDRLRSLPMYPSAILIGRTVSDLARNLVTFAIMLIVGLLVGFRVRGSFADAALATALLLAFAYAFSWIQAFIGLSVRSVEAANSAGFIWMFPLTFVSSAFVGTESMPGWLRPVAEANPFTKVTNAARALYSGQSPGNDAWIALLWAAGITVVFAALSFRRFAAKSQTG